jgi:5-methyltetrahydrofolate--homocysteine methyltransferase
VELKELSQAIILGKRDAARDLTNQAIDSGMEPARVITEGLIAGMAVVGEKFKNNESYVPELLVAARAMHASLDILRPLLVETGVEPVGRAVIGTVRGDLHDIGKNLVAMMLEGAGFEVRDLGVDVKPDQFVQVAREAKADIICMSALLTTTMPGMKDVIAALEQERMRTKVRVLIGGAPITQRYADEIGADGYAPDAASAVDKAKELLKALPRGGAA